MEKNLERAYTYLSESRPYFIATEDADQARVRPFGSLNVHEDKLYISTTKDKPVYVQLRTAPKIELAAMGKDGGWIRVTAEAVEEERHE
ncbi:MAG: pyridoxamine 5'-phosphate oxidase family protein, partial [Clostridiales bacterium]|nr:pyridoxamine 5'-phosphate oxidase family protein [Clostridiales bacterium]